MIANTFFYIAVSLFSKTSDEEQKVAHQFVDVENIHYDVKNYEPENIQLTGKIKLISQLFQQYMPVLLAENKMHQCLIKADVLNKSKINIVELSTLKNTALNSLAGVIGMASAYKAFNSIEIITSKEQQLLANYFSQFFSQLQLSPKELFEQVNFHHQKREMLESHANQQLSTINKLETEMAQRLKAEQALNILNIELEQRVGERTHALSKSNEELNHTLMTLKQTQFQLLENEKMASLGGLVAGVAHEVNTPIGIVLTSISFMKERCIHIIDSLNEQTLTSKQLTKFTQELDKGFELSLRNIERAVELIEGFKLIAVDSVVDDARQLNLQHYLQNILLSLRPKVKSSNITLMLECSDDINIFSYPGAIAQITNNLVLNSLTHAFTEQQEGKVTIKVTSAQDTIVLMFTDDGCKLTEDITSQIFEPFFTTRRGQGGSGLGAHIVYNLVTQKLKGTIELITQQEYGKSFKIVIPKDSRLE